MPNGQVTFDPTDYSQENYKSGLRNWYEQEKKPFDNMPMGDKLRNPLDKAYDQYLGGYKDYFNTQQTKEKEYDPSIEQAQNLQFSEDAIKGLLEGSESTANLFRERAKKDIGDTFNQVQEQTDEKFAQSGLGKSGIQSSVQPEIGAQKAEALSDMELQAQILQNDIAFQAISQLLGIDQMRIGAGQFDTGVAQNENQFSRSMAVNIDQFMQELQLRRDQFEFDKEQAEFDPWRDAVVPILTGGASGGAQALTAKYA